jgi:hypothetical protein
MTPRDERKAMAEKSRTPRATTARGALDAESAGSGRAEVNGGRFRRGLRPRAEQARPLRGRNSTTAEDVDRAV